MLYIVATPIGNLLDISQRALDVLAAVDVIAAEDTRHSARLLAHYAIKTPLISYHSHNEAQRIDALIARLQQGQSIALVSDAGTPLISDPGYPLVRAVRDAGFKVVPVPGACALVAALSASGLASDRFIFEGFLPAKSHARCQRLQAFVNETRTVIFYEAPHRILNLAVDMAAIFAADREVVIARELSKQFESIHHDTVANLAEWLQQSPYNQKGEFVVLLAGAVAEQDAEIDPKTVKLLQLLLAEMPLKQAVNIATELSSYRKKALYQLALTMKEVD